MKKKKIKIFVHYSRKSKKVQSSPRDCYGRVGDSIIIGH